MTRCLNITQIGLTYLVYIIYFKKMNDKGVAVNSFQFIYLKKKRKEKRKKEDLCILDVPILESHNLYNI